MPIARETTDSTSIDINSRALIQVRVAAGRVPWSGPLLLVLARSLLWLTFQSLLALIFLALHRPAPFHSAGEWWMLYGSVSDAWCLFGMRYFTRREGIRLRDLIGPIRLRWGRDILVGSCLLILAFSLFLAGGHFAGWLVYGSMAKIPMEFVMQRHVLPLWATVYSLSVWWIVQSATEEMTYQGYVLPRLQALTGHTWIAFSITGFWFAAQHVMIPFVPDWRYVAYRFFLFVPFVVVWMVAYLRVRRLAPFIGAHWIMDLAAAIMIGVR